MVLKAIIFDLYGTLVSLREQHFLKHLYRQHILRIQEGKTVAELKPWTSAIRDKLMTADLESNPLPDDLISILESELGRNPETLKAAENSLRDLLIEESESAQLIPGAVDVLRFLRRRGFRLGVVSNVSTYHKRAFFRLGLSQFVDVSLFSCDLGIAKPQPEIYLEACSRLGVAAAESVFIGDSYRLDVKTPLRLGLKAVHVSQKSWHSVSVGNVADVGRLVFTDDIHDAKGRLEEVLSTRQPGIVLRDWSIQTDHPTKYNLVYKCVGWRPTGAEYLFVKRHLCPSGVYVEIEARKLMDLLGLPNADHLVIDVAGEPFLLLDAVPGVRHCPGMAWTTSLLRQFGIHAGFAYVFANLDFQPRNAFVEETDNGFVLRMIDFESCFCDVISDVSRNVEPRTTEAGGSRLKMPADDAPMVKRYPLNSRMLKRTASNFVGRALNSDQELALIGGFEEFFNKLENVREVVLRELYEWAAKEPLVLVGYGKHRRPLAQADIERIRDRMAPANRRVVAIALSKTSECINQS
jgi:HAD superfamily hydrolase (TIGR01549 family)